MASTKKPIYNVETKLAPERKRRKSDLVLMWQSFVDVTILVVKELWTTIIRLWEFLQIWFSSSERFLVQTWLEKYLPYVPDDFSESWRDGRLLAILLNKLHPGCFPDAYHLDPDYGLKNVYRIFDALDIYFGIKPNVSVEEIVTCSDGSDLKLFAILLELKNLTDNQPENEEIKIETVESIESSGKDQNCIVKGTGLAVGFVDRISNFIIFCATIADLDVIVEIKGPNSVCSERITKRSPRKRRSGFSFQYARYLTRSASLTDNNNSLDVEEDSDLEKRIIHLEYEIIGNQISLAYKPREKGEHKITILWHGQHVSDSPYFVTIEDPSEVVATKRVIPLKSAFKNTDASEKDDSKKISFQIDNFQNSCVNQEDRRTYKEKTVGKVISRKLIRYIVRINGKDIPVNADSIQALATELLKMDYNIDSCPSFHRRNSWGFAGDAERKKSVIRQFGIDVKELDAQISQKRTRSLSMYPGSKKILEKSDSFDSLTSKLNCLNEDIFENVGKDSENEGHYAYLNENAMMSDEMNEIRSDSPTVTMHDTYSEKNKNEAILLSELTGSKFDKSLEKRSNDATEAEKNSSLSINKTQLEKIDRPEDDLNPNILLYSSPLKCKLINFDKSDDASINYQYTDKNLFTNRSELSHIIKKVNISPKSKIFQMCPKVNNYQKKIHKCSNRNFIIKSFYRKKSKMKIVPFSPIVTNLKTKIISKRTLKKQPFSVSSVPKNILIYRMEKTAEPAFNYEKHLFNSISHDSSRKKLNISPEFKSENKEYKKYKNIEQKCPTNKELKANVDVFAVFTNERLRTQSDFISSKNTLEEPESTKITLKYNFNSAPNFSVCSDKQIKDENKIFNHQRIPILASPRPVVFHNVYKDSNLTQLEEKRKPTNSKLSKPLRIHTLKTCGQFNFAQFNPSLDSDNAISPIKSQIEHWENTLSTENESASPMKLREASDIEQGNVKEKLAFWECRTKESLENSSPQNNRKMNLIVNKKNSLDIPDLSKKDDLQKLHCSESRSNISVAATKEKNDTFINNETNAVANMHETDNEISPEFQTHSTKIRSLSFSDPLVSEITTDKAEITSSLLSSESSRKEYLDLSSDDTFEQYDSDETEDSGGDYLLHSTEDEYIDDEIAERASEYWGDLSIVKNWNVPNCSGNEYSFLDEQFLQNYNQKDKSYPEECKVFGIAVYYGYVAIKNRFQVFTGDAGFGNLSVSIQGVRRHEVSLVSITYMRNDIYEVTYQVMTAGYYLIWIRWMDTNIPGSPFVCKVTF